MVLFGLDPADHMGANRLLQPSEIPFEHKPLQPNVPNDEIKEIWEAGGDER